MPKNPSLLQKIASRNNLRGNYGPQTAVGKSKVAKNGNLNKGAKTAKSRARIINKRWGLNNTLYDTAGCLYCSDICKGKSLSQKTRLDELPIKCFQDLVMTYPNNCFYYFYGLCATKFLSIDLYGYCIIDDFTLETPKINIKSANKFETEISSRIQLISYKKEFEKYYRLFAQKGIQNIDLTPRMRYILKKLDIIFLKPTLCKKTSLNKISELDQTITCLIFNER